MHKPIDPAEVRAAAANLYAEQGFHAEMEVQRRIMEATSMGDAQQTAFWQEVARALQSPGKRIFPNW